MDMKDLDNNCATCGSTTAKKCGKCCKVRYCCRDCQVKDWKNHKLNCNPFEIKESSGKGLGLFATCDLNIGDLIVRENPILYFDAGHTSDDILSDNYSIMLPGSETFKEAYEALSREKKDLVLDLTQDSSSNEVEEEWKKAMRVFGTNCIAVDDDEAKNDAALYATIARINHSCSPNAEWCFMETVRADKEVRAIKRIKKGEEVVADYIADNDFLTYLERKKILSMKWNFECVCSICTSDHATDDAMRTKLKRLHNEIPYYARKFELKSAINAALEKCRILENCEYLVSLLPIAYLELYETIVGAEQITGMIGLKPLPIFGQDYEHYREKAFEMMKKSKLANKKEGYNKKMNRLAKSHGCFRDLGGGQPY
ncbi:N-lysine methyltransferase SMYD2-like [Bolinopsis microptera]|uniref:N-lysine methyltransferase SMYD2-like n=1 Tax=Bolinopsis microptera TaxID=2820187 RepID=UPI0030799200